MGESRFKPVQAGSSQCNRASVNKTGSIELALSNWLYYLQTCLVDMIETSKKDMFQTGVQTCMKTCMKTCYGTCIKF